jgi:hypothetical protein
MPRPLYPGKEPQLKWEIGWAPESSGCLEENIHLLPLLGIKPQLLGCLVCSLVTKLTVVLQLLWGLAQVVSEKLY